MKKVVNLNVSGNSGIFITPEELYQKLGITIGQQVRWRFKKAKHRIPFYRQGKYIRYKLDEVLEWYENTFKEVEEDGESDDAQENGKI